MNLGGSTRIENKEGMFGIVVSAVIENSEDKILVTKRADDRDHRGGEWELISGRVDRGETDLAGALGREVREEVGLVIINPMPFRVFFFERGADKIPHFGVNFFCKFEGPDVVTLDMIEQVDYKWVRPEEALGMIVDLNVAEAVVEYQTFRKHYRPDF